MPKEKFIVLSHCRVGGNHQLWDSPILEKGSIIELDPKNKREAEVLDLLNLAGRVAVWTPKNEAFIKAEMQREAAEIERVQKQREKAMSAEESMARRFVKLLQGTLPAAA